MEQKPPPEISKSPQRKSLVPGAWEKPNLEDRVYELEKELEARDKKLKQLPIPAAVIAAIVTCYSWKLHGPEWYALCFFGYTLLFWYAIKIWTEK